MRVAATSSAAALLLHGAPEGYPLGHPVDGEQHIPRLRGVPENRVPEVLCAFNDRGRAADPSAAGLHFFRADEALLPIIGSPAKYALTFSPYCVVLTPDLTIGEAMAPWRPRARSPCRVWREWCGRNVVSPWFRRFAGERGTTSTTSHQAFRCTASSLSPPTAPAEIPNCAQSSREDSRQ